MRLSPEIGPLGGFEQNGYTPYSRDRESYSGADRGRGSLDSRSKGAAGGDYAAGG
jgi:hypothetical protein